MVIRVLGLFGVSLFSHETEDLFVWQTRLEAIHGRER